MTFTIVRQDITTMGVDAIVNAANTELAMGGGVCGAIFRAAGAEQLQAACRGLAPIKTGEAVITPGFGLKARYVIHAAGPVYRPAEAAESARLLRAAYVNSLKVAVENDCSSVAFPLISSGIYGYPKDEALRVAVSVIEEFLAEHDMDVTLVVFDRSAFALSRDLLGPVEAYIDEHYVATQLTGQTELLDVEMIALAGHAVPERRAAKHRRRDGRPDLATMPRSAPTDASAPLSEVIANLDGGQWHITTSSGHAGTG